jgi:hypothetical protein
MLGYVSVGSGGAGGGWLLISVALLAVGLFRARREPGQAAIVAMILSRALMLLPGALVVYLSFNAGGFFPEQPARIAVLLAVILAGRLALGSGVAAPGRLGGAIMVTFAIYAAWVLASAAWSGAPERALMSFDYVLVYGLAFTLFATSASGSRDMRWVIRGLALSAFLVCVAAFLSRAVPTLWPINASLDTQRLSYPLTYWNALGLLAGLGIVLCVGLTCDDREPRVLKALSASAVPLLAATLLLTFSRGPIGACAIGLVAYMLIGRPRCLLTAVISVGPTIAIAVIVAYRATSLQAVLNGSAAQAHDGHQVALVVAACMLVSGGTRVVVAGLDPMLLGIGASRPPAPQAVVRAGWASAIVVAVIASLALHLPHVAHTAYNRFVQGNAGGAGPELRDRLSYIGADSRITLWTIAFHEFDTARLGGTGAGTYAVVYEADRPDTSQVRNAHSLYFETLAELGVVGVALLVGVLAGSLLAISRRVRKPERALYAAVLGATLAWTVHAGFDWDWQMPAITLPVFVLAGVAAAKGSKSGDRARRRSTPILALLVLAVAIPPALVAVSEHQFDAALADFAQGDCSTATSQANSALTPLNFRPGPHEILGYCHAASNEPRAAEMEMQTAVDDDPKNWEPRYGLAIVEAVAGHDPRPAVRAALQLDPREPVVASATAGFAKRRSEWRTVASAAPLPVDGQYSTSLAVLDAGARGQ